MLPPTPLGRLARDYIALTKPRIIALLLITAIGGMVVAARGWPDLQAIALVVACGYLAAGGANALNHGAERTLYYLSSPIWKGME